MSLELIGVGGYDQVGKNMTVVKYNDEAVILDCGFHLPSLVDFDASGGDRRNLTTKGLQRIGAIPDDTILDSFRDNIKAIIPSHCHLDHVGAVPYIEKKYKAPIVATPYTIEVIKTLAKDDKIRINNKLIPQKTSSTYSVSKNIKVEFIRMTHSTLDTASLAVHTPEGVVLYTNDFKLDNQPTMGGKPDYKRLRKLGEQGNVKALIVDSLYSSKSGKTPSESVAREMLKDVMFGADNKGHAMFVTSFASHIARLRSMVEFGKKLNRKIVFLGRSLNKYVKSAEAIGLTDLSKDVEIMTYSRQVEKKLHQIEKKKDKYLVVCTGSQAEPNAILTRIGDGKLPFKFQHDDHVIFSCKTIPVAPNLENRARLEKSLSNNGVRIFKDVHVSGHGSREDIRDMIKMVKPEVVIPGHGDKKAVTGHIEDLANVLGFKTGKHLRFLQNGEKTLLK